MRLAPNIIVGIKIFKLHSVLSTVQLAYIVICTSYIQIDYLSLDDRETKVHNSLDGVGVGVGVGVGAVTHWLSVFSVTRGKL